MPAWEQIARIFTVEGFSIFIKYNSYYAFYSRRWYNTWCFIDAVVLENSGISATHYTYSSDSASPCLKPVNKGIELIMPHSQCNRPCTVAIVFCNKVISSILIASYLKLD